MHYLSDQVNNSQIYNRQKGLLVKTSNPFYLYKNTNQPISKYKKP